MQTEGILKDIKVVELAWYAMGPLVGKMLAEFGAEVIKVESHARFDPMRVMSPFAGSKPGLNRSGMFSCFNPQKLGITINTSHPEGLRILRRLLTWPDIVIDGFRPNQLRKWGCNYEEISKDKPDLIMISMSIFGQTGPYSQWGGFGNFFQGMVGFNHLTGWEDEEPQCPFTAYPDTIAPWYGLAAVISSLDYRRRTGKGQYIDLSMFETSVQYVIPAILDFAANGHKQFRKGNRIDWAAPHGVYRCMGEDRWCAIAVFTDAEWQILCRVMGKEELAQEPRFATIIERKRREDELDRVMEGWTINYDCEELASKLQSAGVTAGPVKSNRDVVEDSCFWERGFHVKLNHAEMGSTTYSRSSFTLSASPGQISMPAPCLGEHTEYVCCSILGMTDSEFVKLLSEGAFN